MRILEEECHIRCLSSYGREFGHVNPGDRIVGVARDVAHRVFDGKGHACSEVVCEASCRIDEGCYCLGYVSDIGALVRCRVCNVRFLADRISARYHVSVYVESEGCRERRSVVYLPVLQHITQHVIVRIVLF